MAEDHRWAERAPLIHRSTSLRPIYAKDDETEGDISTLRGSCIVASIGLLIFLQGTTLLLSMLNTNNTHNLHHAVSSRSDIC